LVDDENILLACHPGLCMGDIGKPIRETERPAPVRIPMPEPEPEPQREAEPVRARPA